MVFINPLLELLGHFSRKSRVIPIVGIRTRESLEEFDLNPDSLAKFQFLEMPPLTYGIPIVNLTYLYAKKDLSINISLHNEIKAVNRDIDFIYTDGSALNEKAAVIDNDYY